MNKIRIIFLFVLVEVILFSFEIAYVDELDITPQTSYVLPLSLIEIEDAAFSGTAVETVVFPDGFLRIGEKAFDKAWHLTDVYIPETTEYIADSAFPTALNLTIHGIDGSYTKDWARKHEIPFVVDDIWNIFVLKGNSHNTQTNPINRFIATIVLIVFFSFLRSCYYETRSRRPQDRPELYPIEYRFP